MLTKFIVESTQLKTVMLQARRLASQSVSPDQMGVFVGSGPK